MRLIILAVLLLKLCGACKQNKTIPLFQLMPAERTGVTFSNTISSTENFNIFSYRNFYNGGGVALGDFNNDGLPDIYMISNMESNKLYLNKGGFQFEDITDKAGVGGKKAWSTGSVVVDINGDGLLDIYVCNAGYMPEKSNQENELFINKGDLTFEDQAVKYGLNDNGYAIHAAFFDFDIDGDLDAYILNNSFMPVNTLNYSNQRELNAKLWPVKDFLKGGGDKLLRNDDGLFTEVTNEAGIYSSLIGFGLGVSVGDFNGDYLPDLYISNDFFERDYLYINKGDGTFSEELEQRMEHISLASMGADMADLNNDGFQEIFVTEMLPDEEKRLKTEVLFENYPNYYMKLKRGFYHQYMHNSLQYNNGDESFSEIAWYAGVAASDWSWGALLFDTDNDGFREIYTCNGTFQDVTNQDFISFFADEVVQQMALTGEKEEMNYVMNRMPSNKQYNRLFYNNHDLTFNEIGLASGFDTKSFSNGAAYGDLDGDGDLDLVVNNLNQEAFVYKNNSESLSNYHQISIKLNGDVKNNYGIGATILAYSDSSIFNTYIMPSRGFQSSVDYKNILGLGLLEKLDSLIVIWPDKRKSIYFLPSVDTLYVFDYKDSKVSNIKNSYHSPDTIQFVVEIPADFIPHEENEYIDFISEGLIIKMLSREGQTGDCGDVDGDGIEDVFLGGAVGQAAQLYIQKPSGFVKKDIRSFIENANLEDTASEFFDADGDGDLDLYVGSGGNQQPQQSGLLNDRIYINEGNGNFVFRKESLPDNSNNTSVVLPFDIDDDGDIDLFVGSRSISMNYGVPSSSFIYENDGKGNFKDASMYFAPFLQKIGMVTDVVLVDIIEDESEELIVVGEWMSPVVLTKKRGKFEIAETTLSLYNGWWYAVAHDDVDGDGDQDIILGNRGENFYFTGNMNTPAKLWIWDFDNNGSIEKIITRNVDGKDMTLALKKELTEQVTVLNNQELTHEAFSTMSIQDLFAKELLDKALVKKATWFKSAVAINEGNGQFTMKPFQKEVQFSSVNAILVSDLNRDGRNDLVLGGNDDGFMPQFSSLDASFGHVLINDGYGNYKKQPNKESGFFVRGNIRDFKKLKFGENDGFITLINNQRPKIYKKTR